MVVNNKKKKKAFQKDLKSLFIKYRLFWLITALLLVIFMIFFFSDKPDDELVILNDSEVADINISTNQQEILNNNLINPNVQDITMESFNQTIRTMITACELVIDKDDCLLNLSVSLKDENICFFIGNIGLQEGCFKKLSLVKNDSSICSLSMYENAQKVCFMKWHEANNYEPSFCNDYFSIDKDISRCLQEFAFPRLNPDICYLINLDTYRSGCFLELIYLGYNDTSICYDINDEYRLNMCLELAQGEKVEA